MRLLNICVVAALAGCGGGGTGGSSSTPQEFGSAADPVIAADGAWEITCALPGDAEPVLTYDTHEWIYCGSNDGEVFVWVTPTP